MRANLRTANEFPRARERKAVCLSRVKSQRELVEWGEHKSDA